MSERDLFGDDSPPAKRKVVAWGYAAPPGTGPDGETCAGCKHHVVKRMARGYHKCGLAKHLWTGGTKSDIRTRSPACSMWEALPGGEG